MKHKKNEKNGIIILAVAITILFTILKTDAYGQQIDNNQHKINIFNTHDDISVTLNNNFISPDNWEIGSSINNQVSVTNLNDSKDFVFARLQFKEYLEFDQRSMVVDASSNPIFFATWGTGPKIGQYMLWKDKPADYNYTSYTVNGENYCRIQETELKNGIFGKTMYERIPFVVFGTAAKAPYSQQHSIQSDTNPVCKYNIAEWNNTAGTPTRSGNIRSENNTGTPTRSGNIRNENNTGTIAISDFISWTMGTNVITMRDWIDGGAIINEVSLDPMQLGDFWVVDPDGWIYWANMIRPGSTTSNVIESIKLDNMPTNAIDLEYHIHVDMEVCTQDELSTTAAEWGDTSSTNGKSLISELKNLVLINLEISREEGRSFENIKS
ncbi:MAG: hypothetical protein FWC47_09735 [Oscillospiraceae bacterium]|nr:hypothetical protein [Oscillospiraceae bacterium]